MTTGDGPAEASDSITTSLLIIIGLVLTVLVAVLLGLADGELVRLAPEVQVPPVDQLVAVGPMLPTAPLPTSAPTETPTSTPSPSPAASERENARSTPTAVAVLASAPCGNVPAGWLPYTVRYGDTLIGLSAASGASTNEIVQANCLELGVLLAGSQIYLPPVPPARPVCGPPAWWVRYPINHGDTLYSLARRHGTTVYAIMQANCLVSTRIYAGRFLFLPPISAVPIVTATPTSSPTPSPTASPTSTPLPTATTTPVASPTPTATPVSTVTSTPTPTASPSPSATPPGTDTPTPTATVQTATPTGTPHPTATATPTPTSTLMPTDTPTSTSTPSPVPTSTFTSTPTETPTTAPTETPTSTTVPASTAGAHSRR